MDREMDRQMDRQMRGEWFVLYIRVICNLHMIMVVEILLVINSCAMSLSCIWTIISRGIIVWATVDGNGHS
jgi:hypothetical protein